MDEGACGPLFLMWDAIVVLQVHSIVIGVRRLCDSKA